MEKLPYFTLLVAVCGLLIYRVLLTQVGTFKANKNMRFLMACFVSLLVLGSALYIVLSENYDDSSQKWAFGAIGTIIGFWLKPGNE